MSNATVTAARSEVSHGCRRIHGSTGESHVPTRTSKLSNAEEWARWEAKGDPVALRLPRTIRAEAVGADPGQTVDVDDLHERWRTRLTPAVFASTTGRLSGVDADGDQLEVVLERSQGRLVLHADMVVSVQGGATTLEIGCHVGDVTLRRHTVTETAMA